MKKYQSGFGLLGIIISVAVIAVIIWAVTASRNQQSSQQSPCPADQVLVNGACQPGPTPSPTPEPTPAPNPVPNPTPSPAPMPVPNPTPSSSCTQPVNESPYCIPVYQSYQDCGDGTAVINGTRYRKGNDRGCTHPSNP